MSETTEFRWTNGEIQEALDAMTELCLPENRYPVVTAIHAHRNHRRLTEVWSAPDEERVSLVREYGTARDGGFRVMPGDEGFVEFAEKYNALMALEGEPVELEILKLTEIEKGYVRDAETGSKSPLGLSPPTIGALISMGIVTEEN